MTEADSALVRNYEEMLNNANSNESGETSELVLDARSAERFHGKANEPRPGLSSGHMPLALSLPFTRLLTPPRRTQPSYTELLPKAELHSVLQEVMGESTLKSILSGKRRVVSTCVGLGYIRYVVINPVQAQSSCYREAE